jgi:hypothetical protein
VQQSQVGVPNQQSALKTHKKKLNNKLIDSIEITSSQNYQHNPSGSQGANLQQSNNLYSRNQPRGGLGNMASKHIRTDYTQKTHELITNVQKNSNLVTSFKASNPAMTASQHKSNSQSSQNATQAKKQSANITRQSKLGSQQFYTNQPGVGSGSQGGNPLNISQQKHSQELNKILFNQRGYNVHQNGRSRQQNVNQGLIAAHPSNNTKGSVATSSYQNAAKRLAGQPVQEVNYSQLQPVGNQ